MRLKWGVTGPCDELGEHKQIALLPFLGKVRAFPTFDLYFHSNRYVLGERRLVGGQFTVQAGLLEFVILEGVILGFADSELQLFQLARH